MTKLKKLVQMTTTLGDPRRDWVISSEGNTSVRADEATFWIKASGSRMADAEAASFLRVRADDILCILDGPDLSEMEMRALLADSKVDPSTSGSPSIETAMHALCLTLCGATFVGHTHPTAVNAILCARDAREAFSGSIFPAESMVCGKPVFVPYASPGQPLARAVREALRWTLTDQGETPKVLLLQNHGLVAMGRTAQEVLDTTEMMVKASRILVQTYALGGPRFIE